MAFPNDFVVAVRTRDGKTHIVSTRDGDFAGTWRRARAIADAHAKTRRTAKKRKAKTRRRQYRARKHVTKRRKKSGLRISRKKRAWISRKIRVLVREGYSQRQAVAVAYRMAGVARKRRRRKHA